MSNRFLSYLAFPVLIVVLIFLYSFSANRNSHKKIETTVIEFEPGENQFLTHQMVDKMLKQNGVNIKEQIKSSIDLHLLEKEVCKSPYIERANIYMTPSGLLKTRVKQREPIVRVIGKNIDCYIDKYGKQIPLSSSYSARVPFVTDIYSVADVNNIKKLMLYINSDDFLKKEIIAVQKNKEQDLILLVRSAFHKVNIGNVTNLDEKFSKLKVFYDKVFTKTNDKYKEINVKYHNQVVCTKQHQDGRQ